MAPLARLGDRAAALARRVVPDPFVIAIGLAAVTLGVSFVATGEVLQSCQAFAAGMFAPPLLAFGFQMALILVTGHALAAAPAVRAVLARLADRPRSSASAAALVALVALVLGLLNWGLGLVGGAFAAREVGRAFRRRGDRLNYPLIGAAGYLGLVAWHGGLSGSAPLKVATEGPFGPALPVSETIFGPLNLAVTAVLLLALPLLFRALGASGETDLDGYPSLAPADDEGAVAEPGPLDRLERSVVVTLALALPVAAALIGALVERGAGAITLDFVILAFFVGGLLVHRSALAYGRAFGEGAQGAAGILLQFPVYFGILGAAQASGVLADLARVLNDVAAALPFSPDATAPFVTYVSAAFINLLVPSGGGQWVLQQPIISSAVDTLAVSRAEMVMAFAYGDQLTNMLQPFWALPLLSITGLKARELMGYTIVAMLVAAPIFGIALLVF